MFEDANDDIFDETLIDQWDFSIDDLLPLPASGTDVQQFDEADVQMNATENPWTSRPSVPTYGEFAHFNFSLQPSSARQPVPSAETEFDHLRSQKFAPLDISHQPSSMMQHVPSADIEIDLLGLGGHNSFDIPLLSRSAAQPQPITTAETKFDLSGLGIFGPFDLPILSPFTTPPVISTGEGPDLFDFPATAQLATHANTNFTLFPLQLNEPTIIQNESTIGWDIGQLGMFNSQKIEANILPNPDAGVNGPPLINTFVDLDLRDHFGSSNSFLGNHQETQSSDKLLLNSATHDVPSGSSQFPSTFDAISQDGIGQGIGIEATTAAFLPEQAFAKMDAKISGYQMQAYSQNSAGIFGGITGLSQPESNIISDYSKIYNVEGNSSITALDDSEISLLNNSRSTLPRLTSWLNQDTSKSSPSQGRSQQFFTSTFSVYPESQHLVVQVKR